MHCSLRHFNISTLRLSAFRRSPGRPARPTLRPREQKPVKPAVRRQLGMERRRGHVALAHEHRFAAVRREDLDTGARPPDAGRADEDGGHRASERRRIDLAEEGVDLTAVGVARHRDVDEVQAALLRIGHFPRQHDRSGAGAEDGRGPRREGAECLFPGLGLEELPERRRLSARNDQAVGAVEVRGTFRLEALDSDLGERLAMRLEVALEREDGDSPAAPASGLGPPAF